jgi:uncharacterized protein (DUF1697 family)
MTNRPPVARTNESCVALLRAVNVGGRRTLAMAELGACLAKGGFPGARTLLQSGNLVVPSALSPRKLEAELEKLVAKRMSIETRFLVRTAGEWDRAIADNPFPREARSDPSHLLLVPFKSAPDPGRLAGLRAAIAGRERVELRGREAYVHYPDGIGTSRVTLSFLERALGAEGTGRNWNTVLKLAAAVRG